MRKLTPTGVDEGWEQPLLVKTPDDVYRIELRVTMWPDDGIYTVGVETTHEHTRELIAWKCGPNRNLRSLHDGIDPWLAEVKYRILELAEPF